MKSILTLLFAAILLSSCKNNNNPKPGEIIGGGLGQPEDPKNNNNRWANTGTDAPTGGLHEKLVAGCLQQVGVNDPQAKQKCDCWVGKIEAQFPNVKDPREIPENVADQLAQECMRNFNGSNPNPNPVDPYNPNTPVKPNDPYGPVANGSWAPQERQQYIQGCTMTAQQNGLTPQQASSYCDCMTRKIEQKYSFADAGRMTAADFQTPEWQNAIMECYPRQ